MAESGENATVFQCPTAAHEKLLCQNYHHMINTNKIACIIATKGGRVCVELDVLKSRGCVMDERHGWKVEKRMVGGKEVAQLTFETLNSNLLDVVALVFLLYLNHTAILHVFPTREGKKRRLKRLLKLMGDLGLNMKDDPLVKKVKASASVFVHKEELKKMRKELSRLYVRISLPSGHHALMSAEGKARSIVARDGALEVSEAPQHAKRVQVWICTECTEVLTEKASVKDHEQEGHGGRTIPVFPLDDLPLVDVVDCNRCGKLTLAETGD